MKQIESLFFQLLRAGLWNMPLSVTSFEPLSDNDWKKIYQLSLQQALLGVIFDGISQLPTSCQPPRQLHLRWLMMVQHIENMNLNLNKGISELEQIFAAEGIRVILLKGQGVASLYLNPLHRQSGDIDLYFPTTEDFNKVQQWALRQPGVTQSEVIKHVSFKWKGLQVELHRRLEGLHYLPADRCMQRYFRQQLASNQPNRINVGETEVEILPWEMNMIFVMLHALNHFLSVGVGLRQLCDWARMAGSFAKVADKQRVTQLLRQTNMLKIANAFAYIPINYLGLDPQQIPFDYTEEPMAESFLADVLEGGNFGHLRYKRPHGKWIGKSYTALLMIRRNFQFFRLSPTETISYPIYYFFGTLRLIFQGRM